MAGRTRKSSSVRDIVIRDDGSVVRLEALTSRAHAWLVNHVRNNAQWCGETLTVERRYVGPITDAAQFDGLVVVWQRGEPR
jgi:hypothetical protein